MSKVSIIGAGAWGTALACISRRANHEVILWALEDEVVHSINAEKGNPMYLPGVSLDKGIVATGDISEAIAQSQVVFSVVPSQFFRSVAEKIALNINPGTPLVICSKGIEVETGALMTEIAGELIQKNPVLVLSGPSFAHEAIAGSPTAVALAGTNLKDAEIITSLIGTSRFRPYPMDDRIGAEVGGAAKNVLAIACGIVVGREMGDNTRAALITRGLFEMAMLGVAKGAKARTFMGLSGLGDLTLTCNGLNSRNMSLGVELGKGNPLADILANRNSIAEGVETARGIVALARKLNVELPIMEGVYRILHLQADITQAIDNLLDRPFTPEFKGLD